MGFFFLLLSAAVCLIVYQWQKSENRRAAFERAAEETGLLVSYDGMLFRKPWLHGTRDGIRIDVSPFQNTVSDSTIRWIGYRMHFRHPVSLEFNGAGDPKQRLITSLSKEFSECRVDSERLFCARKNITADTDLLVRDIKRLLEAAKELERVTSPELPDFSVTIPVPESTFLRSHPETAEKQVEPPPLPCRGNASEIPEETESIPTPDLDAEPVFLSHPAREETEAREEEVKEIAAENKPLSPLQAAAIALTGSGRNHYDAGREFDSRYHNQVIEGVGTLKKVETFSNDRIFGRGPGLLALFETRTVSPESDRPVSIELLFELPPPEESGMTISDWRRRIGEEIPVCGTAIRFDAFAKRIFLSDSVIEMTAAFIPTR